MAKKIVNQNTRLDEAQYTFIVDVANGVGTDRSDVMRRMVQLAQTLGVDRTVAILKDDQKRSGASVHKRP